MTGFVSRLLRTGALLLAAAAVFAAQAAEPAPLTVFAAASLKESMDQIAALYHKTNGTPVVVSYAASSTLAKQIEHGAPADVFMSADLEWMDALQARALIDQASRRNLLGNTLVLIAPAASTARVTLSQPDTLARALGEGRLAVGQVNAVPAGKYAKAALQSLKLWEPVQDRLAESDSVRSALLLVSRGEAPLGIVYGSDAAADPVCAWLRPSRSGAIGRSSIRWPPSAPAPRPRARPSCSGWAARRPGRSSKSAALPCSNNACCIFRLTSSPPSA